MNACIEMLYLHIYDTKCTISKTNIFLLAKHCLFNKIVMNNIDNLDWYKTVWILLINTGVLFESGQLIVIIRSISPLQHFDFCKYVSQERKVSEHSIGSSNSSFFSWYLTIARFSFSTTWSILQTAVKEHEYANAIPNGFKVFLLSIT